MFDSTPRPNLPTLGVSAPEVLRLALQRLELDVDRSSVHVDLHKIIGDERDELQPLRQWARNRIDEDTAATDPSHSWYS